MEIVRVSVYSGETHTRDIDVTAEQITAWREGELIQTVMPHISSDDREFIMTGMTPLEWKEFAEEQEVEL